MKVLKHSQSQPSLLRDDAAMQVTPKPASSSPRAPTGPLAMLPPRAPRPATAATSSRPRGTGLRAVPPPRGKLAESMDRYTATRWTHERSAALNQIGTESYTQLRRKQLSAIPGAGYLARQYGLGTIKPQVPFGFGYLAPKPGLKTGHADTPSYHRFFAEEEFNAQCMNIYRHQGHQQPETHVLFVNSESSAKRILSKLKHDEKKAGTSAGSRIGRWKAATGLGGKSRPNVRPLHPGLVAIEFKDTPSLKAAAALTLMGGRPSIYEVGKLDHQIRHPAPAAPAAGASKTLLQLFKEDKVDNRQNLIDCFHADGRPLAAALRGLPEGHALRGAADCAASVLDGLEQALATKLGTPQFKHDELVANALGALRSVAGAMPALAEDSARFLPAYAAMMDEVHLLLAAVRPYGGFDFKQAAATMLKARAGAALDQLKIAQPDTYLLSSGMEALSAGIEVARKLTGTKRTQPLARQATLPDYYETLGLKSEGKTWLDKDRVRMAPLNPSRVFKEGDGDHVNNWDADKLAGDTIAWLTEGKINARSPAVLVLDATLETQRPDGKSDLENVLGKLAPHINDGSLKIVLCKSLQKYTALGSAKVMAGAVTVIGADDARTRAASARLKTAEQDLAWIGNDDSQMLTHFMTHAHAHELALIGESARNAAFVDKFCFDAVRDIGALKVQREDHLPFIMVEQGKDHPGKRLMARLVDHRASFGLMGSTMAEVDDHEKPLRITVGRETRAELVEKMYGFGWLNRTGLREFTPAEAAAEIGLIAAEAIPAALRETDVMAWAPAALRVLRGRAESGTADDGDALAAATGECAALLDRLAGMPASTAAGADADRLKASLRSGLVEALYRSEPVAPTLLTDQLKLLGAAFAPRLAPETARENDVGALRAAIRREPDVDPHSPPADDLLRARYASNAIASVLEMTGMAFAHAELAPGELADLEALYSAVLAGGLPGVSPAARANLVSDWAAIQADKLTLQGGGVADRPTQSAVVDELTRHAHLVSYPEARAKMLAMPSDRAFGRLETLERKRLVDTLFAPLDAASRLALIAKLGPDDYVLQPESEKARACIARFAEDLNRSGQGSPALFSPDTLTGAAGPALRAPRPLTAEDSDQIRGQLLAAALGLRNQGSNAPLAELAPLICDHPRTAEVVVAIAEACAGAAYDSGSDSDSYSDSGSDGGTDGGIMSDAQYGALSAQAASLAEPYGAVMQRHINAARSPRPW
ncbi:hypothetical protein JOD97_000550 [Duganella sp. 1411]|uniref:hypothetical protein n=1 Tax=Duganella sp. 1411 TaxID=2806572 RepID=UPI001AE8B2C9|nr:hypothetical protein [Duganella sp. 1411]MBP1202536.1 hypothetical protein [Duganella sp. 1411]